MMTQRGAAVIMSQQYLRRHNGICSNYPASGDPTTADHHGALCMTMQVNGLPYMHAASAGPNPAASLAFRGPPSPPAAEYLLASASWPPS
mmetsp:Transcript_32355/g.82672  ORF Transcript_32355/g.82672 Transcript_32355/m.82672 type:complete len:90 (-) Transcript_32355:293-562(-)